MGRGGGEEAETGLGGSGWGRGGSGWGGGEGEEEGDEGVLVCEGSLGGVGLSTFVIVLADWLANAVL